ncbi:Hypothetical protein DHA2_150160 [Giardia duodenalis]|uniref:Uncharacterized protein n=1 Tax=Giardia intestinalis TaxID=5741 RepID=V6TKK0_GIAIN|nr:Hypothetical protein DHA2_150160 [Giardia intestinalis]
MESLTAASSSTTFRKRLSILGDKKQLAMLCLPFFSVLVFGVHAVRLSVPLLVVHKGEGSQGTVYLLDETGRSDVIATTFKGIPDFSTATVEKFVPLPESTTLVETLPDLKGVSECTNDNCPTTGSSCYKLRTTTIVSTNGPQELLEEIKKIVNSKPDGQGCTVIFSANKINTTTTPFRNAWAPMEATMFSITAVIVVILLIVAVLPSLLIKDSDIMPEADAKTD